MENDLPVAILVTEDRVAISESEHDMPARQSRTMIGHLRHDEGKGADGPENGDLETEIAIRRATTGGSGTRNHQVLRVTRLDGGQLGTKRMETGSGHVSTACDLNRLAVGVEGFHVQNRCLDQCVVVEDCVFEDRRTVGSRIRFEDRGIRIPFAAAPKNHQRQGKGTNRESAGHQGIGIGLVASCAHDQRSMEPNDEFVNAS